MYGSRWRFETIVSTESKATSEPPELEVVIEIPKGSFLKRGSTGQIDFISPLPCPFNYGSVPRLLGLEGDFLDAVVLGPRLPLNTRLTVKARGAVTLTDRGMTDDKLICSGQPLSFRERQNVLRFFRFYAKCKGFLNFFRGRSGRNACDGWCEVSVALMRARPRDASWKKGRDHLTQTELAVRAVCEARPDMTASDALAAVHLVQRQ